ncbi:MAG: FG-GAP-like repeat-containing protein [Microthrixaceae bacterium]|nr:FG-GAP-like repeat-containing protein [Microthrixaceae bacterium]
MAEVDQVKVQGPATPPGVRPSAHLGRYPVLLPKRTDPRLHLAILTTTLQVLGQTVFRFEVSIAQILISIATCAVIELAITFHRDRTIAWPASAMLTGNGIALILRVPGTAYGDWWSLQGWWVFVGCAALAMASKYLIRVGGSHIFNPSNFALVVTFVALGETRADPQVLWWGPLSFGLVLAFVVILTGSAVITRRVGQGHSAASFWVVFAAAVAVIAASGHSITARWHVGPISGWSYWWLLVTSPEVLVFLFFMITDPKTAPRNRSAQVVFGASVAAVGALIISTQSGEFGTKVGILAGLVIMCVFARWLDRRFDGDGRPADLTWRVLVIGAGALLVLGGAVFTLGANSGSGTQNDVPLERRGEVEVDPETLPGVDIDPDAVTSSVTLDDATAERMARATVEDLLLESLALQRGDPDLATAALSGTRLDQATQQIESGGETATATQYTFDSLTATAIRTSSGPQAPPRLAVRVTGESSSGDSATPLDATFTLVAVGDTFLIDDAFDPEGQPIGPRPGAEPPIEKALEPTDSPATPAEIDGLSFENVTAQVGLEVQHSNRSLFEGPAASSGGVAVGDYDDDGDPDVFLTRVGLPNALMRNDGGRFVDVTEPAGLAPIPGDTGSTGAMFVDLTGDGPLDLVVLGLGRSPNRLYIGSTEGTFAAAEGAWELPSPVPPSADGTMYSLTAADYDRDGHIDLFLGADDPSLRRQTLERAGSDGQQPGTCDAVPPVAPTPSDNAGYSVLLRNTGEGLEDRTDRLGLDAAEPVVRAPRFADMNGDGFEDLLLAGRLCTTSVLINDTEGGFVDRTEGSGMEAIHTAHSASLLDADGDGILDWFLSGVAYPTKSGKCPAQDPTASCDGNHLLLGAGDGTFADATDEYGLGDGYWGQGSTSGDFNLDRRVDLMMTNGFEGVATARPDTGTDPDRGYYERGVTDPDRLWLNVGSTPWPQAAGDTGMTSTGPGKAAVSLDYDGDGRLDVLIANTNGVPTLWRNTTENDSHWLAVRLADPTSPNTAGIGATVEVTTSSGSPLTRRITADGSFQSGTGAVAHFGLGPDTDEVEVEVRWPDGTTTSISGAPTDEVLLVTRP